ncbi:pentatricopeptide repeat-containing protein At3g61360-like [Bidens hawaiensis]|uniref:pentatricopeptide repeat-containing protein At3g61360-like n=1 Tax=Bidens hawaiensis TaxID=980011 RepID=UPI00404AD054
MLLTKFKFRYTTQIFRSLSTQTCDLTKPIDEHHVLDQLSVLLPIRHQTTPSLAQTQQLLLLSPEDKLRGVFIQKLNGTNAVKRALTAASVDLEVNSNLIARVINRGNIDGGSMVMLFDWAVEHNKMLFHNVDTYNLLLKALGRRKYFDVMHNVLTDMRIKGLNPDNQTLFIFIDSFLKGKRVSKALRMFGEWECDLDSLKVMLRCLCHRSYVSAASTLLNKMKGKVECDGEAYNIVICGWARFGRVSEIEKVLKEMVEDGFEADSLTFSYALEGLGRNGQIDDAVKMFESLKERELCVLNAAVYNAMIFNFISVGDIDECLKYYDAMLRNGCEPNVDTYVSIISAFLKARRVADALEMFDEMLGRGIMPTTGTVTSFIESLCSYGPPHAAMMIYKKAKDAKCTISVNAYKILLMRLSRFGKCGMLLNLWDEMEQSGYVSDVEVYEHIINGLCNNGQLEDAVVIMEECLKKGFCPSRLISAKLNNKLLDSNKVEMAYKLFLKVKKSRHGENARRFWRAKGWHF